jgi:hypothetical protein
MSRRGVSITLVLSGLLMLPACGSGELVGHSAIRVASVVHIGPYTQVFTSPLPANPVLADVVEAFREGEILWEKSENAQHLVPPVRDYVTGQALTHLAAAMKDGRERDLVPAGVDRLFMTRVTTMAGRRAAVTTCDDASKFKEQNPDTGQVDTSFVSPPGQEYVFETWRMVQHSGHWAIGAVSLATLPSRSAEPCQPGMAGLALPRRPDVAVLLREMSAAVKAASSVHVSGVVRQGGKTLSLNLGITRSGEFSGQVSENGAQFTVLTTRGHTYMKLNAAFLRLAHLPYGLCSTFCGKYLKYPAAQSRKLFPDLNLASLTDSLARTPSRKVKYVGVVTTGGQLAWLLQDSRGNSMYVAARGKPYVLRGVGARGQGSVNLTQWDAVRIPGPPPASQTVSPRQLAGSG